MEFGLAIDCIFRGNKDYCEGKNWEKIFDFLHSERINTIEINSYIRFFKAPQIFEKWLLFLGNQAKKGLDICLHNGSHNLSSPDREKRRSTVEAIIHQVEELCTHFQPSLIVLHPGGVVENKEDIIRERYSYLKESIWPILEISRKRGFKVCLENMRKQYPVEGNRELLDLIGAKRLDHLLRERPDSSFPRVGSSIDRLWKFVKETGSDNLLICIDTGHANISESLKGKCILSRDKLLHLHVSDNFGKDDDHLRPTWGKIDWQSFFKELSLISYEQRYMLEITGDFINAQEPDKHTDAILKVISEEKRFMKSRGAVR